jgi:hypothetical protein
MGVACWTMVGVTAGNNAPGGSVAFGVGTVAFSGKVVSPVTVCAAAAERVFRECVSDSPSCFEPWVVGLELSCFGIDLSTLCHSERLGGRDRCSAESNRAGDVLPLE